MNILGINQVRGMIAWQHDSAAALIKDGKLIAAVEEERFNRITHYRGFPNKAVDSCLKAGGIEYKDIDIVAISYNPYAFLTRGWPNMYWMSFFKDLVNLFIFLWNKNDLEKKTGGKVVFVDHHLSHAASTYRCSGFKKANILTIDGSGETESFVFFVGENGKIKKIWDIPFGGIFDKNKSRSIGFVYTRVTNFMGLGVHGEGKTMGLASYGKPVFDFSSILNINNHKDYKINRSNISRLYPDLERKQNNGEILQKHKNLAASLQKALEISIVNLARESYEYNNLKNFALAGGVTLNCNANSKLLEQDFCNELFIQPAAGDSGAALGAAMEVSAKEGEPADFEMTNVYLGPSFTNQEIEKVLKNSKLKYSLHEKIEEKIAKIICSGKIVGWFQEGMEFGPRALGARSILADPTISGINNIVNINVKHREIWRPFAPSITEESFAKYFTGVSKIKNSSFMLHTFFIKDKYKGKFPAITHIDGSSRIQTVRSDQNKKYYNLLKEIEKINSHPMVLDTSFNDNGEPIVCTPKDAIRCFFSTGLDALVMGNYLIEKNN